jgi:hypothetical protein
LLPDLPVGGVVGGVVGHDLALRGDAIGRRVALLGLEGANWSYIRIGEAQWGPQTARSPKPCGVP